ncbi:MAG: hypothetical protein V3573_14550 [Desulfovibrionaceae bacterium]
MINDQEKIIIQRAVDAALSFGRGLLTTAKEELEDYGYEWTDEHEKYTFETYVKN